MAHPLLACVNHPQKQTRRRCTICHNPICFDCSTRLFKKQFCSQKCLATFILNGIRYPFRRANLFKPIPIHILRPIDILLILFLSVDFFLTWLLWYRNHPHLDTASSQLPVPELISPEKGEIVVQSNLYTISGLAPGGNYAALIKNDSVLAVTNLKHHRFDFVNVPLEKDKNKFRVLVHDLMGKTSIPVEFTIHWKPFLSGSWPRDINRGPIDAKKIALTFDGGSESNATVPILNILREKKLTVTIFLTGHYIERFSDLVRQMVADGHEIGNHTWSHPHLTSFDVGNVQATLPTVNYQFLEEQLKKTSDIFQKITGSKMAPFWRAPFGEHNVEIRRWAEQFGYRHISWTSEGGWKNNMDSMDWVFEKSDNTYLSSDQIMQKILDFGNDSPAGKKGAIVLMHLGTGREGDALYLKLPQIIDKLEEQGYHIVKVSELLEQSVALK